MPWDAPPSAFISNSMYFQRDSQWGLVFPQQILSSPDGVFFYTPTFAEREPPNSTRRLQAAATSPLKMHCNRICCPPNAWAWCGLMPRCQDATLAASPCQKFTFPLLLHYFSSRICKSPANPMQMWGVNPELSAAGEGDTML